MGKAVMKGFALAMWIGAGGLAAGAGPAPQASPRGEPLAIEATPLLPLDSESAISIVGIKGLIAIETRDERELRVVSREPGPEGGERTVGIWQEGSKLILAPAPGDMGGERQIRVEVPRSFAIGIEAAETIVTIDGARGGIDLRGKNVRAFINSHGGSLAADLDGGSLELRQSNDASLKLRSTAAAISGMSGNVMVRATGGSISLARIDGTTDVECEDSKLLMDDMPGSIHVKARRGDTTVTGSKGIVGLELSGGPLHLNGGKGDITVTSDAPVDFTTMAAAMHLDMDGGSLRGQGSQGMIDVHIRDAEVNVGSLDQGVRLRGNGLKAHLADVGGELFIETSVSDVIAERVGKVLLSVDRGDVTIQGATGVVAATVTAGDVHIVDAAGPVSLDLEGGDAEVSWASLSGDKDSKLINKSGNITARFPSSAKCRVEARSKHGHVESNLPTVRVMDSRTEAQGPINFGNRPFVNIVADGDIHLQDASKVNDEPPEQ
jgi:hypothetical protein